ncbi:hypothetical protein ANCCEY_07128, partial [Ancylostoma ceylanicum]
LAYINPQCLSYPKRPGIASFQALKTDWKKDTVYLYQFPRSKALPNVSPFCLKVETFIKANKIPYEVSLPAFSPSPESPPCVQVCPVRMSRSEYGLLPFIELNGEHIADSQIIINRLIEHFNVKADCTVFGQLATTLYIPSSSHAKDVLKDQYPALVEYCNRIRDTVFGKDFTSE